MLQRSLICIGALALLLTGAGREPVLSADAVQASRVFVTDPTTPANKAAVSATGRMFVSSDTTPVTFTQDTSMALRDGVTDTTAVVVGGRLKTLTILSDSGENQVGVTNNRLQVDAGSVSFTQNWVDQFTGEITLANGATLSHYYTIPSGKKLIIQKFGGSSTASGSIKVFRVGGTLLRHATLTGAAGANQWAELSISYVSAVSAGSSTVEIRLISSNNGNSMTGFFTGYLE